MPGVAWSSGCQQKTGRHWIGYRDSHTWTEDNASTRDTPEMLRSSCHRGHAIRKHSLNLKVTSRQNSAPLYFCSLRSRYFTDIYIIRDFVTVCI